MSDSQTPTPSDAEQITDQQDKKLAAQQKSDRTPKPRRSAKKASKRKAKASKERKKAKAKKVAKKKASESKATLKEAKCEQVLVVEEQDQLLAYLDSEEGQLVAGDPGLTPRQRKKRTKGLPEIENLRVLARTWLEQAHKLYPDLVKVGVVPEITDANTQQLVDAFINRFVGGEPTPFEIQLDAEAYVAVAAVYCRYSDDNSNATSLDDQLSQAMQKAASEKRFIPWEYCFADASVTGRTQLRRGYVLAKEALHRFRESALDTLYIDDFSRASRAAIETYRLARLMEVLKLRLIGVSDGFVLGTEAAHILIMAAAMFNEWFITQLRKKVLRGMKGAAKRGTSLGMVVFGYKLVDKLDENGNPIINAKDKTVKVPVIDEEHRHDVIRAAKWITKDHLPYKEVARRFNAAKVKGSASWTGSHISKLMANPMYAGTCIYNRTSTIWDKETGEFSREPNPESEWIVRDAPELRIIDEDLWERLRARADEVASKAPRTGKKLDRNGKTMPECMINDLYPTTIVDGVLFCSSCGREMRLIHSDGKHKQLACPNGSNHVNSCELHSSKSLNQITAGLFAYINRHVLTEDRMADLVTAANAYLAEEAATQKPDMKPLKVALADLKNEAKENIEFVRKHRNEFDMSDYLKLGEELNKKIATLQQQLREAEAANAEPPPPIDLGDVLGYLDDLRGLLDQSVESSAYAMRALFGKVMVEEADIPGRKRKAWIGHINGNLVPLMAKASKMLQCPDSGTWEFLLTRIWKYEFLAEVSLCETPAYVLYAEELKALHDDGVSVEMIASRYGMSSSWVQKSIRFAETGARPQVTGGKRTGEQVGKPPKYIAIADDVNRLKARKMSFPKIQAWLLEYRGIEVREGTIRRSWNYANPQAVKKAVEERTSPAERASYRNLPADTFSLIKQMLAEGHDVREIATAAGCSTNTVYRLRRQG